MQLRLILPVLFVVANLSAQDLSVATNATSPQHALSINFALAPIVTLSGRVLDAGGKAAGGVNVTLVPLNVATSAVEAVQRTVQADSRGNFAIRGVVPGSYLLLANLKEKDKEYWSEQRINVGENDINGVQLQLSGGVDISGKVSATGGGEPDFQLLHVRLSPEDGNSTDVSTDVAKDGKFTLQDVRRTSLRLQLLGLPDGWYLRSAAFGQQDVLNQGLRLAQGDVDHSLDITLSSAVATVAGVVLEPASDDFVPHAVVKLFPDPPNPHRGDLFRSAVTGGDGRFIIKNVVPGHYRILALMGGRATLESNPDDAATAAAAGVRVVVGEKQRKNVEFEAFQAHR